MTAGPDHEIQPGELTIDLLESRRQPKTLAEALGLTRPVPEYVERTCEKVAEAKAQLWNALVIVALFAAAGAVLVMPAVVIWFYGWLL